VPYSSKTVTWLTQEAYDRLKAELEQLTGSGRAEMAERIAAAREEGDLKENGAYHAAKEEQGKQEARIRQLEQLLENAQVGEAPVDAGIVAPGMVVTVRLFDEDESMTFLLGSREDTDGHLEAYSPQSPLGSAVHDRKVGDTVSYELPNGHRAQVEILDAKPYTG